MQEDGSTRKTDAILLMIENNCAHIKLRKYNKCQHNKPKNGRSMEGKL